LLYLATYGTATIAASLLGGPLFVKVIFWLVTAFLAAALFLVIAQLTGDPRLAIVDTKDEILSLGITK
jgi:hypothetical protein